MNYRILVAVAVEAEKEAIVRGLMGDSRFDVLAVGVGSVLAAVNTTKKLIEANYDLVISAGIGGGFIGRADIGSVVVADQVNAADLGAESQEGFLSLDELGFGSTQLEVETNLADKICQTLSAKGISVHKGAVLTVSTVTGTAETAQELTRRVPTAAAEAMEGYGVAAAAHHMGIPFIELRTISNLVGPRDRSSWRIKEALDALTTASTVLLEVLK